LIFICEYRDGATCSFPGALWSCMVALVLVFGVVGWKAYC
jgi:hypothetical protein